MQCVLGLHTSRHIFRGNHNSAYFVAAEPGANIPRDPPRGAITSNEPVFICAQRFSSQTAAVDFLPLCRNLEAYIVCAIDRGDPLSAGIPPSAAARRQIAYVVVKHRNRSRCVLDE